MDARSTFDVEEFHAARAARGIRLGASLVASAATGSTNDDALDAARAGAPHGTTFVADAQSRGRGRRGHTWTSPAGENLTFSVVLRPRLSMERISALTLVAGLAVRAAAAARVAHPIAVKWPNDVVAGRRKLAGILVEAQVTGSEAAFVVVGIGINVLMRTLPEDIAAIATSLALLGDPAPAREALLAEILGELETRLDAFEGAGLASCLDELRAHDALIGVRVTIDGLTGTGAGIGDDGALRVRDDAGELHEVLAGVVSW